MPHGIQPHTLEAAYLERRFRAKLPRDLRDKLEKMVLVQVNHEHDAWRVQFTTGQEAIIPALKLADDATIAHLCLVIK